jgi:hypothetical protein
VPLSAEYCGLCARELAGGVASEEAADSHRSFGAGSSELRLPWADGVPVWLDRGTVLAVASGPAFILCYPRLLAFLARMPPGSIRFDLVLGVCWVLPGLYLLGGAVKAAQFANAKQSFLAGLVAPGVSVALQLLAIPFTMAAISGSASSVTVYGLHGAALSFTWPVALYCLTSLLAAAAAFHTPRVIPGKFQRVVAPQLIGLASVAVALLLPNWGGVAIARRALNLGFPNLVISIAMLFTTLCFALFWFRAED